LPAPLTHKQQDAASYDSVASEFDYFAQRFSGVMADRVIELGRVKSTSRVLDIGTGTGLVALRAAALTHAPVIGIDHSLGALEQARVQARQHGMDNLSFHNMDAESLEFADSSFDVALSLYALLHFPAPLTAIRQMYRVLRPGGRVVIGVGRGPNLFSWSAVMEGARRLTESVAAARGHLLIAPEFIHRVMLEHGLSPVPNYRLHRHLPVARMLRKVGFRHVRTCWLGCRKELDADEFWRLQVTFDSPSRTRLQQASPQEVAGIQQNFLEQCRNVQAKKGTLTYRYAAMFYTGARV
jgi:SAM-dependent methyltransferase